MDLWYGSRQAKSSEQKQPVTGETTSETIQGGFWVRDPQTRQPGTPEIKSITVTKDSNGEVIDVKHGEPVSVVEQSKDEGFKLFGKRIL